MAQIQEQQVGQLNKELAWYCFNTAREKLALTNQNIFNNVWHFKILIVAEVKD